MIKGISHFVCFCALLCLASSSACAQNLSLQTWFEKNQNGNFFEVSVHFLSNEEEISLMNYEIVVEENQKVLSASSSSGEFLSVPQLPTLLASLNFKLNPKAKGLVKLKLFQGTKVIWQDQIQLMNNEAVVQNKVEAPPVELQQQKIQSVVTNAKPLQQSKNQPVQKTKIDKVSSPFFEDAEIGGLIIDESRTKLGRDFYEQFFNKWIAPNGVGDSFIIKIKELPSFGRVSRISVEVNNVVLMTPSISPNVQQLEANVNASIRGVRRFLVQRLQMGKDIENEDQIGTGIY